MHRIADLHPELAKTDARDAANITEAARSMPHRLRSVGLDDETLAESGVLSLADRTKIPFIFNSGSNQMIRDRFGNGFSQ